MIPHEREPSFRWDTLPAVLMLAITGVIILIGFFWMIEEAKKEQVITGQTEANYDSTR